MSQHDLYAAPRSSVSGPTLSERALDASGAYPLASVGQRIGASLLDGVILVPLFVLQAYLSSVSRLVDVAALIGYQVVLAVYCASMVAIYGGTPGKLIMNLRVVMLDRTRATWTAGMLRYAVWGILGILMCAVQVVGTLSLPDEAYAGGFLTHGAALEDQLPGWTLAINVLSFAVGLACLVMLLATKQRRTMYDFLAGTIVVRTR